MRTRYDISKIKYATGSPVWERAVALYESGKVTEFEDQETNFTAIVLGGNPYNVWVSADRYDIGDCACYLGQNEELCKHIVALAIHAVIGGRPLSDKEKTLISAPVASGRKEALSKEESKLWQEEITASMRYIKPYNGPSRAWFAYQASLSEGANRLAAIISELPVCLESARLLVNMLLRLDKKLCTGGVDDSDGTIGGFMEETVDVLEKYAALDAACISAFLALKNRETCFGWEQPLVSLLK